MSTVAKATGTAETAGRRLMGSNGLGLTFIDAGRAEFMWCRRWFRVGASDHGGRRQPTVGGGQAVRPTHTLVA